MSLKADKNPFHAKVRQRLVKAIGDLHPEIEIVRVRAWTGREAAIGQRWVADERGLGRGTHEAYLVILKRKDR